MPPPAVVPVPLSSTQLDAIAALVTEFPDGASLAQLRERLSPPPPNRTLQRWLAELVRDKRIEVSGRARDVRYRARTLATSSKAAEIAVPIIAGAADAPPRMPPVTSDARSLDEQVSDHAIGLIIREPHGRDGALKILQHFAERNWVDRGERRASLQRMKARLEAFSAADADALGFEPEQYARWRARYFGDTSDTAPAPVTRSALPVPAADATVDSPNDRAPSPDAVSPTPALVAPSSQRPRPGVPADAPEAIIPAGTEPPAGECSANAVTAPGGSPATGAASFGMSSEDAQPPSSADGAATLSTALMDGAAGPAAPPTAVEAFFDRANGARRQLMTPGRIAASAVVGAALSVSADTFLGHGPTWLITAPLAAIPPVYYLSRDRTAQSKPLDAPAISTAVAAGATSLAIGKSAALMLHSLF